MVRVCNCLFFKDSFLKKFPVPQMLAMMVDLEDDDEWAMADELEDDDFDRYNLMTITNY